MAIPARAPKHFTGREAELAWLMDALEPGRTVTLCAAGGMGKTALASEALHRLAAQGELACCSPTAWSRTASTGDRPRTPRSSPSSTPMSVEPQGDLAGAVHGLLASRTALIVLDGAEQADDLTDVTPRRCPDSCGVLDHHAAQQPGPRHGVAQGPAPAAPGAGRHAAARVRGRVGAGGRGRRDAVRAWSAICRWHCGWRDAISLRAWSTPQEYAEDLERWGLQRAGTRREPASDSVPMLMAKSVAQVSDEARARIGRGRAAGAARVRRRAGGRRAGRGTRAGAPRAERTGRLRPAGAPPVDQPLRHRPRAGAQLRAHGAGRG